MNVKLVFLDVSNNKIDELESIVVNEVGENIEIMRMSGNGVNMESAMSRLLRRL